MARVAALVADTSRARILCHLLGGEYASASELARAAGVSAGTTSGHLAQLLDSGLVACEPRGRHRYYRLADAEIAHALEALALVAERGTHDRAWASPAKARLRHARCCYGHLAGQLGVAMLQHMLETGWLIAAEGHFTLSARGVDGLADLGLDGAAWSRRMGAHGVAYGCLDWSERRDHLAGSLAAALLRHFIDQGWLRRVDGERALQLTPRGRQQLAPRLGLLPTA